MSSQKIIITNLLLVLFIGTPVFLIAIPYGIYYFGKLADTKLNFSSVLDSTGWEIFAIALIIFGLIFTFWSLFHMIFKYNTSPMGSAPKGDLITTGPYSFSRHPMWFGNLLVYTGTAIFANSLSAIFITLAIWIIFFIYLRFVEENKLLRTFGKDYEIYRQNVPMLFPKFNCPFRK